MVIAYQALAGGLLIGASATLLLACDGRIAGISGILNGVYPNSSHERNWRLLFLLSLVGAAAVAFHFVPASRPQRADFPVEVLLAAGLIVGFGTRMANGCTSGHGVCGLGRLSVRSLAAVLVFVAVAILTVTATRRWGSFP